MSGCKECKHAHDVKGCASTHAETALKLLAEGKVGEAKKNLESLQTHLSEWVHCLIPLYSSSLSKARCWNRDSLNIWLMFKVFCQLWGNLHCRFPRLGRDTHMSEQIYDWLFSHRFSPLNQRNQTYFERKIFNFNVNIIIILYSPLRLAQFLGFQVVWLNVCIVLVFSFTYSWTNMRLIFIFSIARFLDAFRSWRLAAFFASIIE